MNFLKHLLLWFCMVFPGLSTDAAPLFAQSPQDLPPTDTNTYTFNIHQSLPPYRFQLVRALGSSRITRIRVFRGTNSHPAQVLTNEFETMEGPTNILQAEDANFDGFLDLTTIVSRGHGSLIYYMWLYDVRSQTFRFNRELSQLSSPKFISETKQIETSWNGGAAGRINASEVFVWADGKLKLVMASRQDEANHPMWDRKNRKLHVTPLREEGELFVCVTREWVNGAWRTTTSYSNGIP